MTPLASAPRILPAVPAAPQGNRPAAQGADQTGFAALLDQAMPTDASAKRAAQTETGNPPETGTGTQPDTAELPVRLVWSAPAPGGAAPSAVAGRATTAPPALAAPDPESMVAKADPAADIELAEGTEATVKAGTPDPVALMAAEAAPPARQRPDLSNASAAGRINTDSTPQPAADAAPRSAVPDTTASQPAVGIDRPVPPSSGLPDGTGVASGVDGPADPAGTRQIARPDAAAPSRAAQPLDVTHADWTARLAETAAARLAADGGTLDLALHPAELGSLRITVTVSGSDASVQIVTETPEAARLFSDAERRLAEDLGRSGLTLTQHQASAQDRGAARDHASSGPASRHRSETDQPAAPPPLRRPDRGLVNLIA
jgi:flagellar hook-length control protein FliK